MANVRIVVDGDTWMDGDPGTWSQKPPAQLVEQLQRGAKTEPWMKAVMILLAEAAMQAKALNINVQTRPTGWTLSVD